MTMREWAITLFLFAAVCVATGELVNQVLKLDCKSYQETTGKPTKYVEYSSCYVEKDGELFRLV